MKVSDDWLCMTLIWKQLFAVHDGNLEFRSGKGWGWCLIGIHPSGKTDDNETYLICEESIGMILDAEQPEGVQIIREL